MTAPDQLTHFTNFSGRDFDEYVLDLPQNSTGCQQPGVLPVPLAMNDTCYPGWLCLNSDDDHPPQYCPPTPECQAKRMTEMVCAEPQGFYEPKICDNGHYCPEGGKKQIACPKGTFCPTGSVAPLNCSTGAVCPEQSHKQIFVIPVAIVCALDVLLLAAVGASYVIRRYQYKRYRRKYRWFNQFDGAMDDFSPYARLFGRKLAQQTPPAAETCTPSDSDAASIETGSGGRRALSRVDNMDGHVNHAIDDGIEEDSDSSPEIRLFLQSMARAIDTSSTGLAFDFENLTFKTKKGQTILDHVSGSIPKGSCWGIIGGSGAGKTTLVNTLMGKQRATSGTIKINGSRKCVSRYRKLIGYVPQDEIVFPELTVRENILHSARCRLPSRWTDTAIQEHVDSLIACLQLTHVQHKRVGDERKPVISGGQRKRVNIGMELVAAPMAIFLDEPTSGLDASSALGVMRLLRAISRLGVTIVAIVHQPRETIFNAFDHLLVLAEGHSVYSGPTENVHEYFVALGFAFASEGNPADIVMDITTGPGAQRYVGAMRRSVGADMHRRADAVSAMRPHNLTLPLALSADQEASLTRTIKARGASWPVQVYYCLCRATVQQVRNSTSLCFEIGVAGLAGILMGLSAYTAGGHLFQGIYQGSFAQLSSAVDYDSTPQLGLLGGMAIGLAASAPGFWVFGEEKLMYWRESAAGHSPSAYYTGKLLSTFPRITLSALHFTIFLYLLAAPLMPFMRMFVANLFYFWCVYGLASVVSMLVKRENGPLIAVLASLIIGVLGGVAPPLKTVMKWHMGWFWRMSPGVWFTEAYFTENLMPMAYLYQLHLAEAATGFTLGQYSLDVGMLFAIGLVYRVLAFPLMLLMHRDKQR
ncbi:hypothetical protein BDY17DRAFT_336481 [Neohortaea acidophila]|uniref:ABC transporter domain-containing protein n=1 Tax=Neohortaea acidophila TaxID=245834 RepID=A0A6A6PKC5_9PEZI|nr:uncharacterized protein BDY17DRAFT_336481 [Neohortaea acidophila]KAF2480385.1 hypothetical protein BDY17DRAFT_336481 [Neohortaea acidophila]